MMQRKIHSSLILLLNYLVPGILGDFQALSNLRCREDSYNKHVQVGGAGNCETNCNNNQNCKAFMYCAAGIPAWCVENCFYYTHTCSSASEDNGFTLYRKKVHGGWTIWSEWSACSVTCGDGINERSRSCTNPAPQIDGDGCAGSEMDNKVCVRPYCSGIIVLQEFSSGPLTMDEGNVTQRIKCAAICSASRSCISFRIDSDRNCITKETNGDEGYSIV